MSYRQKFREVDFFSYLRPNYIVPFRTIGIFYSEDNSQARFHVSHVQIDLRRSRSLLYNSHRFVRFSRASTKGGHLMSSKIDWQKRQCNIQVPTIRVTRGASNLYIKDPSNGMRSNFPLVDL